ncbi:hypothetical protein V5739_05420 [Salinimicrobium sp. TIG7-5_MAKvit]|uniref:hypothetical protein n=1 Tax=Salinimicrobium sp. TIG7-5_MAKvit TaxID=3121289 RepID=UPI003C6E21BD
MKLSAQFYVVIATIFLILVAALVFYNAPYNIVFYTVLVGQAWWLLTVYKVLVDDYSTKKTFNDWYEDHPKIEE